MKQWLLISILALLISACKPQFIEKSPSNQEPPQPVAPTPTSPPVKADLADYGPAPELENTTWLNTKDALRLADLKGKVVLLDMWTFG